MTQKELLYFEDAVSHESIIGSLLENMINELEDENLVSFIEEELNKHNNTKEKLMNLMEDEQNEG